MKYDPDKHHRQSIRLKGYDYSSAGGYFITICTHQRECLFGEVVDGVMQLNELGEIVAQEWEHTPNLRREIKLDAWIVMPNHFHQNLRAVETPAFMHGGKAQANLFAVPLSGLDK